MAIQLVLFLAILLASSAQSQYYWGIPCRTVDQCASVMGPTQLYQCSQGFCFCANHTSPLLYELCSHNEMLLTAKASGLRRNCTTHEDCSSVNGANCLPKDGDKNKSSKICLCQLDMVESADGQRCLPAARDIGGLCLERAQCTSRLQEGADCVEGSCKCLATHHKGKSGRCVRNLGFAEHCKLEEDGCYESNTPSGDNLLVCSSQYGCRCKKHWTYNQRSKHCEYSGASQILISLSTISALVLLIAFF